MTLQNPGDDGIAGTNDDVTAPLNRLPADVSVDFQANSGCGDESDRIRNFLSRHTGGANFLPGDGSVRFVSESIDAALYRGASTLSGGEVLGEF